MFKLIVSNTSTVDCCREITGSAAMVFIEGLIIVEYTGWEKSFFGIYIVAIDIDCHGSSSTRNSGKVVDVPMLDEDTELVFGSDTVANLCTVRFDPGERPQKETESDEEFHSIR